jgi:hypothetical protein
MRKIPKANHHCQDAGADCGPNPEGLPIADSRSCLRTPDADDVDERNHLSLPCDHQNKLIVGLLGNPAHNGLSVANLYPDFGPNFEVV